MSVSRALRMIAFAVAALVSGTALAGNPALVVEVDSGRVLHAERATDPWYPASVTKLMTAYVALDQVRSGLMSMDKLLTVSESAAALPPSKMGFKPGTQIRLDNALKIILVKSANDVAATIAENIGGSIEGFSEMMNAHARRLGMKDSTFANPHGLPDERNQTTARDMAILARALLQEFPDYRDLFDIGAIKLGSRIMRNTNGLIGRYPGADGMKTGFICSSGFNVVASATRNGRHLITVVLGAPSANERTMKAAELFDRGFSSKVNFTNPELTALPESAATAPPDMRSVICDRRGPMPKEEDSPVVAEEDSGIPNLFSDVMAYSGETPEPVRTVLGPRAAVKPEQVWVGLNPPSEAELAAQAEEEKAKSQPKKKAAGTSKKKPAQEAASKKDDASASEKKQAGAKKDQPRASISVKPVSDTAKTDAKAAPKPQPSAGAKAKPQKADAAAKPKTAAN